MKIALIIALILISGCKDITREIWNAVGPKFEKTEHEKTVKISASVDEATGPTELETLYTATGVKSVVYCDDGGSYSLLITVDEVARLFKFSPFTITYDDQVCELFVYLEGTWELIGQERFFFNRLALDEDSEYDEIFINFTEITINEN